MRATVVKYGDPELARAIADGMVRALSDTDAEAGVRAYADSLRWASAVEELQDKYPVEEHGRVYRAILGIWAYIWLCVHDWTEFFKAWNRS